MQWDNRNTNELIKAVLALKNVKEAKAFLRDLLTEAEILEFGNRWKAARMLSENIPYEKIAAETGLSSRTIARISKWLKSGMGGYKAMIKHHHSDSLVGRG